MMNCYLYYTGDKLSGFLKTKRELPPPAIKVSEEEYHTALSDAGVNSAKTAAALSENGERLHRLYSLYDAIMDAIEGGVKR